MRFGSKALVVMEGLLVAVLVSCGRADKSAPSRFGESPARAVRVTQAQMRPMERALPVVGVLQAHESATVAAQVAGQVEKTLVDLGDSVTVGQELARIDTTSYDALARQAAANLAKAAASAANAEQNLKRIQDLQKEKIASSSELDQAVAAADQARAEVKAAEAAEAIARLNLERSRVRAPFDGAVAARIATVGDYVGVAAPIVRLVKTDPLRLRLDVPERESPAVQVGQTVHVFVERDTNVYSGRITRVSPAIRQEDRMLPVEADVPNPGTLRAGLFARTRIIVNAQEEALSVPANALTAFAGLEKVFVVESGKALERTVITGRRGPDWVEVTSGLASGEMIVLDPVGLRSGQAVTVGEPKMATSSRGNGASARP